MEVLSLTRECFEGLKKQTLGIQTPWSDLTRYNTIFTISGFICRQMDDHICRNNKKALENRIAIKRIGICFK
jgi:hypothetical protein